MRLLKAACFLFFVSCSSSPTGNTPANIDGTASIEGIVREAGSGAPIPGASVFLVRSLDQLQVRTITDAEGRFSLPVDAGRHVVAATSRRLCRSRTPGIVGASVSGDSGRSVSRMWLSPCSARGLSPDESCVRTELRHRVSKFSFSRIFT